MDFPLDINSAYLLLTVITLILFLTSEFINPRYGRVNIIIDKNRLRLVVRLSLALFIASTAIRITSQVVTYLRA